MQHVFDDAWNFMGWYRGFSIARAYVSPAPAGKSTFVFIVITSLST
jgi:hypothetical protein